MLSFSLQVLFDVRGNLQQSAFLEIIQLLHYPILTVPRRALVVHWMILYHNNRQFVLVRGESRTIDDFGQLR